MRGCSRVPFLLALDASHIRIFVYVTRRFPLKFRDQRGDLYARGSVFREIGRKFKELYKTPARLSIRIVHQMITFTIKAFSIGLYYTVMYKSVDNENTFKRQTNNYLEHCIFQCRQNHIIVKIKCLDSYIMQVFFKI